MLKLEKLILETVNEVIRNVFDDEVADMLLRYLDEYNHLSIDERLRLFDETLPKIFGSGAVIIEDLILETLYSKMGIRLEKREKDFVESINDLRLVKVKANE
ncbi:hypothetical protein J7K07_00275 [Candidatus Bathyarchaeota archaeon]|nr:hypothetical protein [Candidatus Bathyarchaeota archaeon]RLG22364.1 MAG: hypothetical protein DRN85_10825 [Methanosarcinales archaeon]